MSVSAVQPTFVKTDTQLVIRFPKHSDLDIKIYNPAFFELLGFRGVETSVVVPGTQTGGDGTGETAEVDQRLTYPYKYFQFLFKRFTPSPGSLALIPKVVPESVNPEPAKKEVAKEPAKESPAPAVEFPKSKFNPLKSIGDALASAYNSIHLPDWAKTNGIYDTQKKPESAKENPLASLLETHPVDVNIPKPTDKPAKIENPEKSFGENRETDLETKPAIPTKPDIPKESPPMIPESVGEKQPVADIPKVPVNSGTDLKVPVNSGTDLKVPELAGTDVKVPVNSGTESNEPAITETIEISIPLESNPLKEKDDDIAAQDDIEFDDVLRFSRLEHQYSVYVRGEFHSVLGRLIKLGPVEQQSPETPDTLAEYLFERLTLDNTKIHKYAKIYAPSPK
jgi:hypothetical protein